MGLNNAYDASSGFPNASLPVPAMSLASAPWRGPGAKKKKLRAIVRGQIPARGRRRDGGDLKPECPRHGHGNAAERLSDEIDAVGVHASVVLPVLLLCLYCICVCISVLSVFVSI